MYRVVFILQFKDGLFLGLDGHPVVSFRAAARYHDPEMLVDTARFSCPGDAFELHRLFVLVD
jgi:hypothetical protein